MGKVENLSHDLLKLIKDTYILLTFVPGTASVVRGTVQDLTNGLSIHNQISTVLSDAYFATSCPSFFWGC